MKKHITISEAARLCRVSRKTLYNWLETGKIHAQREGDRWKIPPESMNALLERGRDPP